MGSNVFLLEDDYFLRDGLCELLRKESYQIQSAQTCEQARQVLLRSSFDLLILDVMLPDGSGLDLCRALRSQGDDTPILFLTACDEEYQIVRGLDAGADDYVTKPFKMLEFLSRVRALLRRRKTAVSTRENMLLDDLAMCFNKQGEQIPLTKTEYQILNTLIRHRGTTVTRNLLLERIWDCDGDYIDDNTLSVHISRLRDKIGSGHIVTVRGCGYRWEEKP